jgi:hypothetical protein
MSNTSRDSVAAAIKSVSKEQPFPRDLAFHLLNVWIANLQATEARIDRTLVSIFTIFTGFMALDTGLISKVVFQGVELQRTGRIFCLVPIVIAYLYYRIWAQVEFVHDLRTAIALLYKELCQEIYFAGLDLFAHLPSVRNLEMYDSLRPTKKMSFYERTTNVVVASILGGPVLALTYCLYRLRVYPDVGFFLWLGTVILCALFLIRGLMYGGYGKPDLFAKRQ